MAAQSDWFAVHRKLINSDLWLREPFTRGQAWVDLLGLAAYKPGYARIRGVRVEFHRGQYVFAERYLSQRWKWSRGKLRRFLDELKTDRQIDLRSDSVSTVLTVTNYESYQLGGTANGTTGSTTNGPQTGPQTDQSRKKEKKEKKDKKVTPPEDPVSDFEPAALRPAICDWLEYKLERRESYKPRGLKSLLTTIRKSADQYGVAAVEDAINSSMSSNYAGILWDRLERAARNNTPQRSRVDSELARLDEMMGHTQPEQPLALEHYGD